MNSVAREYNFDGIVGPTHNYSGLSFGNIASVSHQHQVSNPREGALQGLAKMKRLHDLGLAQGFLPPQERPDLSALRRLGFCGTDAEVLSDAQKKAPELLNAVCSTSSMWTANAATVSPSADTQDRKVHFTTANLVNKFHRAIEAPTTSRVLQAVFKDESLFAHHPALPASDQLGDEGAANHTRFCVEYGDPGLEFFVYGRKGFDNKAPGPRKFPARQTYEASSVVMRSHGLHPEKVVFAQQNPDLIDAGVFHNDVASVGNRDVLFYHEQAFRNSDQVIAELQKKFSKVSGGKDLVLVSVPTSSVSVEDAVRSYLFNSQLVSLPEGGMSLIAPSECEETPSVKQYLDELLSSGGSLKSVEFMNLRQSMKNGGGPACLRLRVVLTEEEEKGSNPHLFFNDSIYQTLTQWVTRFYRDRLEVKDLADPQLVIESRAALDELTQILHLGSIYPFQM